MKHRRHHNNYGAHTVRSGKTTDQVKRMGAKLGIPVGATRRRDDTGPLRILASAERYVMVRRPGAVPFVMALDKWDTLPPDTGSMT